LEPDRAWLGLLAGLSIALLLAAITPSTSPSGARGEQAAQQRIAAAEMQRAVDSVRQAASAGGPITTSFSASPAASGEAGQVERLVKSALARTVAERRNYEAEFQALGWAQVIDPDRLKSDPSALAGSRAMIPRAREIIARCRSRTEALHAAARRDIEAADLRPATRRTMLAAMDESAARNKALAAASWDLEEQQIGEIAAVLDLLGSRQGAWQARGGKFVFQRRADLDLFNAHMKNISAAVNKQRQAELDRLQRISDGLTVARR
jgi:hypothetical protein